MRQLLAVRPLLEGTAPKMPIARLGWSSAWAGEALEAGSKLLKRV